MAAGEGARLQPITSTQPKHLIKVGRKPILEHCLEALKHAGIVDALIVVHFMADSIRQYFGNGDRFGMRVEYVEQKAMVGTGNAVGYAEPYVKDEFMLVYGDLLFTGNVVKKVLSIHEREKPAATMAVVPVDKPENYGIVEFKNENHVRRVIEKPDREKAPTNFANAGIYVLETGIFEKARQVATSSRGECEITDAISVMAEENRTVLAVKVPAEDWLDIGRPWDLLAANAWTLTRMKHKIEGLVEDGAHIVGPVTVAESARIRAGAYVEGPSAIDESSDIGPNCFVRPCTSIGRRVRVGNACEIKNSLIMDGVHIGHLSYVGDSVIGEKCNLGAGTITANYRLDAQTVKLKIEGKIIDSERKKLGAILGDSVKSGINSLFMPGVKVGSNSWVGPNVIVEHDLPSDTVVLLKQTVEKRELKR